MKRLPAIVIYRANRFDNKWALAGNDGPNRDSLAERARTNQAARARSSGDARRIPAKAKRVPTERPRDMATYELLPTAHSARRGGRAASVVGPPRTTAC